MPTPDYPEALPLPSNFQLTAADQTLADEPAGPRDVRRRTLVPGATAQIMFRFLETDYALFKEWFKDELLNGLRWFSISLFSAGGLTPHIVRFATRPRGVLRGHRLFEVTAELEIRERRMAPAVAPPEPPMEWLIPQGPPADLMDPVPPAQSPAMLAAVEEFTAIVVERGRGEFEEASKNFSYTGGTATVSAGTKPALQDGGALAGVGRYNMTPGLYDVFGDLEYGSFIDSDAPFHYTFSSPISAVSMYITDIGDFAGTLTLKFYNGATLVHERIIVNDIGTNGNLTYYGLVLSSGTIDKIEFDIVQAPGTPVFDYDHIGFDSIVVGDYGTPTPLLMTFEGIILGGGFDQDPIGDFYRYTHNVTFSPNALVSVNGGTPYRPGSVGVLTPSTTDPVYLNRPLGFSDCSFWGNSFNGHAVTWGVYSEVNGLGTLLTSGSIAGGAGGVWSNYTEVNPSFGSLAKSIKFHAPTAPGAGYWNIDDVQLVR